ncbi:MAG TPA: RtcB family protein [Actinomycetes bacterium]|jgi:tRNA-splicing ligase RtcB|nr:RtcB family protein [Actinomycetes bacterium]
MSEPRKLGPFTWEIPVGWVEGMRVHGVVYASDELFSRAVQDRAVDQVANVATLPGIVGASYAMPDIHWGYGFPIGGVAATDVGDGGVVSPGGVGYDIGCGVRLLRSELRWERDVRGRIRELVRVLSRRVPRGTGGKGLLPLTGDEVDRVLVEGVQFPISRGVGSQDDAAACEDGGRLAGAMPEHVSQRARERGRPQLGSLGGGNHFLEVQVVDQVRDQRAAEALGLFQGQVCVMLHSGSRGIGHQACTDHLRVIERLMPETGVHVPDRQLACLPVGHEAARAYLGAMAATGNFAVANRHVMADAVRAAFAEALGRPAGELGMRLVYDVAHNLAKLEEHRVDGRSRLLCVHRKGATRALGPGHPALPERYRHIGQPVINPGSMGTWSFVLVGDARAEERSFASTCHGAGRAMSRTRAKKIMSGPDLRRQLEHEGVVLAVQDWKLLSEEAPYAYKDATEVVETCEGAGLSRVVARLRPAGVLKG